MNAFSSKIKHDFGNPGRFPSTVSWVCFSWDVVVACELILSDCIAALFKLLSELTQSL